MFDERQGESTDFSTSQNIEHQRQSNGFLASEGIIIHHQETTEFSTGNEINIDPQREGTWFSMNEHNDEVLKNNEFSTNEEEILIMDFTEKEGTSRLEENIDCFLENDHIDRLTSMEMTPKAKTPPETLFEEPQEVEQQQIPLQYGDLVVVDYAEKKKIYKWPAIVFPSPVSYLIVACTSRTHDG